MISPWTDIEYVKKRLRCAKRRAVYWSGNPSFNFRARAVDKKNEHEFKYELALCDVHSYLAHWLSWKTDHHRTAGKARPFERRLRASTTHTLLATA